MKQSNNRTLFLDRDGVINRRLIGSYVQYWDEFEFLEGSLEAIVGLKDYFDCIVIVTNQQGIGKGIMTIQDFEKVDEKMHLEIEQAGGKIEKTYCCPQLAKDKPICRKPNIGMALEAKKDFPNIDFSNATMVGDSISDMQFGERLAMKNVLIETKPEALLWLENNRIQIDIRFTSLYDFYMYMKECYSLENEQLKL